MCQSIEEKIADLEARVKSLEARVSNIEYSLNLISSQVDNFGNYKNRNSHELKLMNEQINLMIDSCESLLKDAFNQRDIDRAKSVLRRLKNNKTRVAKALAA